MIDFNCPQIFVRDTIVVTARVPAPKPQGFQAFRKCQGGFSSVALSRGVSRYLSRWKLFQIKGLGCLSRCLAKNPLTYVCAHTRGYITATARQRDNIINYYYLFIYINRLNSIVFVSLLSRCCRAGCACGGKPLKRNKIMGFYCGG